MSSLFGIVFPCYSLSLLSIYPQEPTALLTPRSLSNPGQDTSHKPWVSFVDDDMQVLLWEFGTIRAT